MNSYLRDNLDTFKQTFQKPSCIYRFLSESWKTNPLFLTRTLSYVRKDRDRNGACNNSKPAQSKALTCLFNWVCDNPAKTSQKTKSDGYACPWCELDLKRLDTLMMHLRCCHFRFKYNLVSEQGDSVIEMTLNKSFDGSYCGFKYPGHNLRRDFRFTPRVPERRTPTTRFIHFKQRKKRNVEKDLNLTKVLGDLRYLNHHYPKIKVEQNNLQSDDEEADVDVCSGRLYYHTSTCLPVKPNECDIDSEADIDPEWLRERTQLMIDEFTDVNEGEKEVLKLWNLHIMRNYRYKGDNMMPQACFDFVDLEGSTILSKNLVKNFTLHLANLFDFGLISSGDLLECIRRLKAMKPPTSNNQVKSTTKIKLERNEHCQNPPPAKRALLNSHCNQ